MNEFYSANGFLPGIECVDRRIALNLREQLLSVYSSPPDLPDPWELKSHLLFPDIFSVATSKSVLDRVEEVLGPDIFLLSADIFIKPANSDKIVNWHQDGNYWGFEPFAVTTAWVALGDVDINNGCMQFMPKTHTGRLNHIETYAANSALSRGQEIQFNSETEGTPYNNELKAGEVSIHHSLLAHYSGPNRTNQPRVGLAIRYMPADIVQTNTPAGTVTLVRGQDKLKRFNYDRPAQQLLGKKECDSHAAALVAHRATKYSTV